MDQKSWEKSYQNKDNFVFYPHEEVIRFISKYARKRIGLDSFQDQIDFHQKPKALDVGCGIGRHVMYLESIGIEAYGLDLAEKAIQVAQEWFTRNGYRDEKERLFQGDVRELPWGNNFFDFAVSHGVFDSMPYEIAEKGFQEVARVLKAQGLFYVDLVSGDDRAHFREFAGEERIKGAHEHGTIQSYFNFSRLEKLVSSQFEILECVLIRREAVLSGVSSSRYHLALKKRG